MTEEVIAAVRAAYPDIKIFLWTGYKFPNLKTTNEYIKTILNCTDVIIDDKFKEKYKNLNLRLRGSLNQRIWEKDSKGIWCESDE